MTLTRACPCGAPRHGAAWWRAMARRWSSGDADPHWHGCWRPYEDALAQARRWVRDDYAEVVWVESFPGTDPQDPATPAPEGVRWLVVEEAAP